MIKILAISALLLIIVSCTSNKELTLDNDPVVVQHFTDSELADLIKILDFFENEICDSLTSTNIDDCYETLWSGSQQVDSLDELGIQISYEGQERLFSELSPDLFTEIWFYRDDYVPKNQDTVLSIHYKWPGKYFDFLNSVAETDSTITEHVKAMTLVSDISPSILFHTMIHSKKYDYSIERIRLIIAITCLTFNEQIRLGSYRE